MSREALTILPPPPKNLSVTAFSTKVLSSEFRTLFSYLLLETGPPF